MNPSTNKNKKKFESTILQINLGHRRAASYDLQLRTRKMARFIALLQEPWLVRGKMVGLSSQHKTIIAPSNDGEPTRAAIYHHVDTKISPHPSFTGRDIASGIWDINMPNLSQIMLISVYWDGKAAVLPPKLIECL